MSGVGHPWSGQCNILLYDPEERREVPEEVPFHLWLPPPLHRHHPLLLRHLLQGATEQVSLGIDSGSADSDLDILIRFDPVFN